MPRLSQVFLHNDRAKTATAIFTLNGVKFNVAYYYSEAFQNALRSAQKDGAQRVFAEYLLLGWSDLEGDDGQPLEPTVENREMVLRDYAEVFGRIITFSQNAQNFIDAEKIKDELGN